ncbi:MAG: hypothetical protein ACRDD1_01550, partial [Planctomycetia bacterium]
VERHLAYALSAVDLESQFRFLLAARLWAERLADRSDGRRRIRLPEEVPTADPDGNADLRACANWFSTKAKEIGLLFDRRNGTDEFQRRNDEHSELLSLAVD